MKFSTILSTMAVAMPAVAAAMDSPAADLGSKALENLNGPAPVRVEQISNQPGSGFFRSAKRAKRAERKAGAADIKGVNNRVAKFSDEIADVTDKSFKRAEGEKKKGAGDGLEDLFGGFESQLNQAGGGKAKEGAAGQEGAAAPKKEVKTTDEDEGEEEGSEEEGKPEAQKSEAKKPEAEKSEPKKADAPLDALSGLTGGLQGKGSPLEGVTGSANKAAPKEKEATKEKDVTKKSEPTGLDEADKLLLEHEAFIKEHEEKDAPKEGGEKGAPKEGGEQTAPKEGGEKTAPKEGGEKDAGKKKEALDDLFSGLDGLGGQGAGAGRA